MFVFAKGRGRASLGQRAEHQRIRAECNSMLEQPCRHLLDNRAENRDIEAESIFGFWVMAPFRKLVERRAEPRGLRADVCFAFKRTADQGLQRLGQHREIRAANHVFAFMLCVCCWL